MTKLEYFNEIMKRIDDGRLPCVGDNDKCVYRNEKGNACVIGLLIPDEEYNPDIEGKGIGYKDVTSLVFKQIPYGLCLDDLGVIQEIHDSWASGRFGRDEAVERFKEAMGIEGEENEL